jgi:hypothetical protein
MNLRLFQVIETQMAPLSARQEKAAALAREIARLAGFVLDALPLRNDQREMRVQILDKDPHIRETLESWGWALAYGGPHPRVSYFGMEPATVYHLEIPLERQPIADNRIRGELADPDKKTSAEMEGMRKYLGLK